MKISFIIRYYNEPIHMLRECLDSVLSLSLQKEECEVIVIDDGSNVSPCNEIKSISDTVIYVRQENKGRSGACNRGLELASGDFIQFVDADDTLLSSYNAIIDLLRVEDPDILQFLFTRDKSVQSEKPIEITFRGTGVQRLNSAHVRGAAWSYAFRRNLLGNLRFMDDIYHEDELFTPLLFIKGKKVLDTSAFAYFYRVRANSITNTIDYMPLQKRLNDIQTVIETLSAVNNPVLRRRVSFLVITYLYNCITLTRSLKEVRMRLRLLKKKGLFPIPIHVYNTKYFVLSIMSHLIRWI